MQTTYENYVKRYNIGLEIASENDDIPKFMTCEEFEDKEYEEVEEWEQLK